MEHILGLLECWVVMEFEINLDFFYYFFSTFINFFIKSLISARIVTSWYKIVFVFSCGGVFTKFILWKHP